MTHIDPARQHIRLGNKETLSFTAALLATGASAARLQVPGATGDDLLDGVHYLRSLDEATGLRQELHQAQRVAIIGAGFLGCEVAASAIMLGRQVTLISREPMPLYGALGPEMAAVYRDLHIERGVQLLVNTEVAELRGHSRVEQLVLNDGRVLDADTVVIAVGAQPRTNLGQLAGLEVNDGIITDDSLTTSAPGIYAAGDVAAVWNPVRGRYERRRHFNTARTQGKAAARSMLGEHVSYTAVPFVFSDQYDVWMEYTGTPGPDTQLVVHGDVALRQFVAFWLRDEKLQAAMNVGLQGVPQMVRPLIHSGQHVSDHRLREIAASATSVAEL